MSKKLRHSANSYTQYLSLAHHIIAEVASTSSLEQLASRVTASIRSTLDCLCAALFILQPDQRYLHLVGKAVRADYSGCIPQRVEASFGPVGQAAQFGKEIVVNGAGCPDVPSVVQSEVALPLKLGHDLIGVLDIQSEYAHAFDEATLPLLRVLADSVAIAVEHIRLSSDLARRADQLSAVAEVSRAITSILDIELLLENVVQLIHEKFAYPHVYLFTIDHARGQIVYRAGVGPVPQLPQAGEWVYSLEAEAGVVPWVASHGQPVLVDDLLEQGSNSGFAPASAQARSELAIPLIFGERVLGVLDVRSDRPGAFGEEDRRLLEALADSIAAAIRNANLYRSEQWRRQVADNLREMAGLLLADVSLEHKLDAILSGLERILPSDAAAIWLLNDGSLCLSAVHGYATGACMLDSSPGSDSWLGQALLAEQPLIRTPDLPPEPLGMSLGFPPDYSAIAAPMLAGERRLGVLSLVHHTPGRYGAESRLITAAFASYAAIAIENTRLYQEAQELARISTVMLRVAEATRSLTTLDQVLNTITRLLPELVGIERCAILLWEESTAAFLPAAAYGFTTFQEEIFFNWKVIPARYPALGELCRHKAPVFIYDVAGDSRLPDLMLWDLGFESVLLLPLLAQDDVVGAMLVDYRSEWFRPPWPSVALHDERLATIQGVALQTATAIENARLREAQQEEAYVSVALLQVAQTVAHQSSLTEVLNAIARITPILVGGKGCAIFLWEMEHSVFRPAGAYGFGSLKEADGPLSPMRQYAPEDFPLLNLLREQLAPVIHKANEVDAVVPRDLAAMLKKDNMALIAFPLAVQGNLLGAMLVLEESDRSHPLGHRLEARRMEIIAGIAHQTALAIQSDLLRRGIAERERLELELQLAHEIQRAFMPAQPPLLPGWELAFTWRAARQVAGDFYDFFTLPGGRLGLVIADVADKGMPAALFMALTRTLIRATALEESAPADVLARVNDLLVPDAQSGMFVTAVYATVSLETGELVYANAGHNLPLLLRASTGELQRLDKGGMALGVLEGIHIQEHRVVLQPGDYLILYTDGVTEAFAPENGALLNIYGEERLWAVIQATQGSSAQAMLEAINNSVDEFVGNALPSDDRTMMILRRAAS